MTFRKFSSYLTENTVNRPYIYQPFKAIYLRIYLFEVYTYLTKALVAEAI